MATTAPPPILNDQRAVPIEPRKPRTGSRMWASHLIAAVFLADFVLYGGGWILVSSVVDGPDRPGSPVPEAAKARAGPRNHR